MTTNITINKISIQFKVWTHEDDAVFDKSFAFDCETTAIDMKRPWVVPTYVVGAACDGKTGYFVLPANLPAFIDAHHHLPWVMHHAPFDLAVVNQLAPNRDIYGLVDESRVWDTRLLHRLFVLGTEGHPATWQSSLQHCAKLYLGVELEKEAKDKNGNEIRLSFGKYLHKPIEEINPKALEYLAMDAAATIQVYRQLRKKIRDLLDASEDAWGYVGSDWLGDAKKTWGPLTHHIQLRSAIVLDAITANGLPIDVAAGDKLRQDLQTVFDELKDKLKLEGYMPGQKGCKKHCRKS